MGSRGGQPQQLTSAGGTRPSWSRDGNWVYFSANGLWKVPASGGNAVQLTRHGGTDPTESEDGAATYYFGSGKIMRVSAGGSGEKTVIDGVLPEQARSFTLTHEGIY